MLGSKVTCFTVKLRDKDLAKYSIPLKLDLIFTLLGETHDKFATLVGEEFLLLSFVRTKEAKIAG